MPPAFWKWFDGVRREKDYSDRQMAEAAKISHSVISKARSGTQPIGYDALVKIGSAFGLSAPMMLKLAGRTGQDEALSPEQQAWLAIFDALDEIDREEMLAIGRARARRRGHGQQPATTV